MPPDAAPETEQQRSARDFLRQMREHFRTEADPTRREEWMRQNTERRTREELQAISEHVNTLRADEIDAAERELVHRICTQQLRRFREQIQSSLSTRDVVTLGALGVGGGFLLYKIGRFLQHPIRNTTDALRRPLSSLFKVVTGGLITAAGVFFGAATIERVFGRHAADRMNDAAGTVNPLGGVATGDAVPGHNTADNPANNNTGTETQNLPPATGATRERARTVFAGTPPVPTGTPDVPATRRALIRQQLEVARTNNRPFSLVQAYELQAEEETDQLNTLLAARPAQPEAIRACRLRLTYIETVSRALKQYGDLIDRYYGVRELCAASGVQITEPGKDAAIEAHISSVLELAQARLQAGFGSAGNGAQMDTAEANLWRSLQGERNNEGQTNATQGIPMVERTVELLQLRYAHLANAASRAVRPEEYGADGELLDMHRELANHLRTRANTEADQEQKNHLLATATRLERGRMILRPDPSGLRSLNDRGGSVWVGLVNFNLPNFRAGSITQMFTLTRTLNQVGIQEAGLRELFNTAFAGRTWPVTDGGEVRQVDAYERYQRLAGLRLGANSGTPLTEFKAQGAQNVAHLAGLHESLVSFQSDRARLATLRNRTTTPGAPSGEQGIWGAGNADLAARYDQFFVAQHTDAVDRLQAHTTMMDRDVLNVGPLDNAEHAWNKNGREFMVYLADNITKLQTFVLPDEVLGMQVNLRTMTREYLLGELPNLMGWPRKADGHLKDWGDFTPGEREAMRAKQESIITCINRFKDAGKAEGNTGHYENFKTSTNLMKDFQANSTEVQAWLQDSQNETDVRQEDIAEFQTIRVKSFAEVRELIERNPTKKAAIIAACCDQFVDDTKEYMTAYRGLVEGFHNVVGLHFEWAEAFDAFASKQIDLLLGWLLVCGAAVAAWIFRRGLTRLATRGVRGTANIIRRPFVARPTGSGTPRVPPGTPPPLPSGGVRQPGQSATNALGELPESWSKGLAAFKEANLARGAAPEVSQAVDRAALRCAQAGMTAEEAFVFLKNPTILSALSSSAEGLVDSLKLAHAAGPKTVQRLSNYIVLLGEKPLANALKPSVIEAVLKSDASVEVLSRLLSPKNAKVASQLATKSPEELSKMIAELSAWQKAGRFARGAYVAGVAVEALMVGMDIVELIEANKKIQDLLGNLDRQLKSGGFEKQGEFYVHPKSGAKVEIKSLEQSIQQMNEAATQRLVVDSAALATSLIAPSLCLGPAGLVIAGVVIIVHCGIAINEALRDRDFLEKTPAPVLALLTTARTVGRHEGEVVGEYSSWNTSDFFSTRDNEAQKQIIRRKCIGIMLYRELVALSQLSPDIYNEIAGDRDLGEMLDEKNGPLLARNGDFDRIIQPFVAMKLYQNMPDDNARWSDVKNLKTNYGWFDALSGAQIQVVLRDSLYLYAQHLREKKYRIQERDVARLATPDQLVATPLTAGYQIQNRGVELVKYDSQTARLSEAGKHQIFKTDLKTLPALSNGKTYIEHQLQLMSDALDARAGSSTKKEAQAASGGRLFSFDVPPELRSASGDKLQQIRLDQFAGLSRGLDIAPIKEQYERVTKQMGDIIDVFDRNRIGELPLARRANEGRYPATYDDFMALKDLSFKLESSPNLDPGGWIRNQIASLDKWNLGNNNFLDGDYHRRTEAYCNVLRSLKKLFSKLSRDRYNFIPLEEPTDKKLPVLSNGNRAESLYYLNGVSVIHAKVGEQTYTFSAEEGPADKDIPGVGIVRCEKGPSKDVLGRQFIEEYRWYFVPKVSGATVRFFTRELADGYNHDGARLKWHKAIAALKLNGPVLDEQKRPYYTRDGKEGKYYMQDDGSVFWTGGQTYVDGDWKAVAEPTVSEPRTAMQFTLEKGVEKQISYDTTQTSFDIRVSEFENNNQWMQDLPCVISLTDGVKIEGRICRMVGTRDGKRQQIPVFAYAIVRLPDQTTMPFGQWMLQRGGASPEAAQKQYAELAADKKRLADRPGPEFIDARYFKTVDDQQKESLLIRITPGAAAKGATYDVEDTFGQKITYSPRVLPKPEEYTAVPLTMLRNGIFMVEDSALSGQQQTPTNHMTIDGSVLTMNMKSGKQVKATVRVKVEKDEHQRNKAVMTLENIQIFDRTKKVFVPQMEAPREDWPEGKITGTYVKTKKEPPTFGWEFKPELEGDTEIASYMLEQARTGVRVNVGRPAAEVAAPTRPLVIGLNEDLRISNRTCIVTIPRTAGLAPEQFTLTAGQPVPEGLSKDFNASWEEDTSLPTGGRWILTRLETYNDAINVTIGNQTQTVVWSRVPVANYGTAGAYNVDSSHRGTHRANRDGETHTAVLNDDYGYAFETSERCRITLHEKKFKQDREGHDTSEFTIEDTSYDLTPDSIPAALTQKFGCEYKADPRNPSKKCWHFKNGFSSRSTMQGFDVTAGETTRRYRFEGEWIDPAATQAPEQSTATATPERPVAQAPGGQEIVHPERPFFVAAETCTVVIPGEGSTAEQRFTLQRGQEPPSGLIGYLDVSFGSNPSQSSQQGWRIKCDNAGLNNIQVITGDQTRNIRFEYSAAEQAAARRAIAQAGR